MNSEISEIHYFNCAIQIIIERSSLQPPPPTIPEDLAQGSMVKDELVSIVDDLDTVENPFFFYMVDEEMRQCNC